MVAAMCMQCIAGAMTAGATATGLRSWLAVRYGHLLTPRRKKVLSGALIGAGILAGGVVGPSA